MDYFYKKYNKKFLKSQGRKRGGRKKEENVFGRRRNSSFGFGKDLVWGMGRHFRVRGRSGFCPVNPPALLWYVY
jgi:hypothetical protein